MRQATDGMMGAPSGSNSSKSAGSYIWGQAGCSSPLLCFLRAEDCWTQPTETSAFGGLRIQTQPTGQLAKLAKQTEHGRPSNGLDRNCCESFCGKIEQTLPHSPFRKPTGPGPSRAGRVLLAGARGEAICDRRWAVTNVAFGAPRGSSRLVPLNRFGSRTFWVRSSCSHLSGEGS